MRKDSEKWKIVKKSSRPTIGYREAALIKDMLSKTLKVGIEFEWNLPKNTATCKMNDVSCTCKSVFKTKSGETCYTVCTKKGNCELEKQYGCHGVSCIEFEPPCDSCSKFDRGCNTCPKKYDASKDPEAIRNKLITRLSPTKFLGNVGKYGVLDVVKDGSLDGDGGCEVVTVGRRVNFDTLHRMCDNIIKESVDYGVYVNERCSVHFHLLCGYLNSSRYNSQRPNYGLPGGTGEKIEVKDLEFPIPEIVLANFHQLWRRFENAIVWLTSTGESTKSLTRWIKFRRSLLQFSAVRSHMRTLIKEELGSAPNNNHGRYYMVNYSPTEFNEEGAVTQFHLEVRAPDGLLSASATAAFACLFYGMLMKAVDISTYGIVESGDQEYMTRAKDIQAHLCNNDGGYDSSRISNTSSVDVFIPELIAQAEELIRLVKPVLLKQGNSYEILSNLAQRPISIRRSRGDSWKTIENTLYPEELHKKQSLVEAKLMQSVDLSMVHECSNVEEWVSVVAEDVDSTPDVLMGYVSKLMEDGLVYWNSKTGSLVRR